MDADALKLRKLTERALRDGTAIPLSLLLESVTPVRRMRELAQKLGLSPKGFRIERAPAAVLAPLLAELREPGQLEQVVALLFADRGGAAVPGGVAATPADADDPSLPPEPSVAAPPDRAAWQFRGQELQRLRADLERARQAAVRVHEREAQLRQAAERDAEQIQRLRGELLRAQRPPTTEPDPVDAIGRDRDRRLHDLEQEIAAREDADAALRRQLAVEHTRVRVLEDEIAELVALLPKGRRRKAPAEPPPLPPHRFLLPYFLPSFYRSLDGRDRRAVERALQAILLFCTEGHAYPGLDVKQLGGQDMWSLRASLGLRVYFRHRADGDVEFLELADREGQNTTLRRLKER